jgi:hypothetical protein
MRKRHAHLNPRLENISAQKLTYLSVGAILAMRRADALCEP